jgi:hypothetical protein
VRLPHRGGHVAVVEGLAVGFLAAVVAVAVAVVAGYTGFSVGRQDSEGSGESMLLLG